MNSKYFLSTIFLLILVIYLPAQPDVIRSIAVEARVLEQLKGNIRSVPNAKLNMVGLGEYATDENGRFSFEAPIRDYNRRQASVVIEIRVNDYDIIRPYQGKVQLDTSSTRFNIEILVMGRDIEEDYRHQLTALSKKLNVTQRKNALSIKRMNAMNNSLLVSLEKDALQKAELENVITDLKEKAESEAAQKEAFAEDLTRAQKQMDQLRESLEAKEDELYIALEEKYLRQQNYQKAITADLEEYLLYVKDVHDLLQNLDRYFKSGKYPNYANTYNSTLKAYNDIFIKINKNYRDYVQGVKRYWEAPLLARQVEDTFEILLDQVHHPKLKPAISEVNSYIRKNKSGKATKVAHDAFHDLNPLILNLEKAVDRLLSKLE